MDHCHNQDCSAHGRCQNNVDGLGYTCHCVPGYVGQSCDQTRCQFGDITCLNGGTCGPEGCRCTNEWTGDRCEQPVHVQCQDRDCGYGTCHSRNAVECTADNHAEPSYQEDASSNDTSFSLDFWAPTTSDLSQWLEFTYPSEFIMTGIEVETPASDSGEGYVRELYIQYKRYDADDWSYVRDEANGQ